MKIVRTGEIEWNEVVNHGRFHQRRKGLGGDKMPCGLWELPPGKCSFPLHKHHVTEEALFVLSGRAKVRTLEGETPIGPGDYVSFPAGGVAHQIVNDGTEPLVYLGLSAVSGSDIVEYPESGKLGCRTAEGQRFMFRHKDAVTDYFEGEE
jgi:uncharacterized cupin superfamily protein